MTTALADSQRRRAKIDRMRANGGEPFPHFEPQRRSLITELISRFDLRDMQPGDDSPSRYHLAGRLVGRRKSRKTTLLDLQDRSGKSRLCVRAATATADILEADIGDIVAVTGHTYVTNQGGLGFEVESGSLLAKALRLPLGKGHAINKEIANRQELELIARAAHRQLFTTRAAMITALRQWMNRRDFVEVETPILQSLAGGALARPFVTHHNALRRDVSLRISCELFLQRCIVGGLERVYELGKCFRNEGISRRHSPEFSMLEWSMAYSDYRDAADAAEEFITYVAEEALGNLRPKYRGATINLETPWRRLTLQEAINERTGLDIFTASPKDLSAALPGSPSATICWADAVLGLYSECVEPHLIQPTIVYDFPLETHPCVKRHPTRPQLGESFDVVFGGVELCSGGTGLNDPDEQWARFVEQRNEQGDGGEPHPNDKEYVAALQYGMPPVAGGGLGIDRLVMVLLDSDAIMEVTLFPASR